MIIPAASALARASLSKGAPAAAGAGAKSNKTVQPAMVGRARLPAAGLLGDEFEVCVQGLGQGRGLGRGIMCRAGRTNLF